MKFSALAVAAGLLATAAASAQAQRPAGSFDIDPAHSKVGFEVAHLVISSVEGAFSVVDGKVVLADDFAKSVVQATVDVQSIGTGNGQRDDHLRSADFFDAGKHPKMTFASTGIEGTPESFKLKGNLTIKGVTKPVVFDGRYLGTVKDGFGNEKVAFKATTKIKRQDFGLTWNKAVEVGPVVGDDVTIDLNVQAGRPAAKT